MTLCRNSTDITVTVFYPRLDREFLEWVQRLNSEKISLRPTTPPGAYGWNVKPHALLQLLNEGQYEVVWIDSDILVMKDVCSVFSGLPQDVLVATEEALGFQDEVDGLRARLWGFPVGRTFPFPLNPAVMRVTSSHVPLLKRWKELLESPAYEEAQGKPWAERPPHMCSDLDVLTALLCSREFHTVPVTVLRRKSHILQFCGPYGFTLAERGMSMARGMPIFIHSQGWKPFLAPDNETVKGFASKMRAIYRELSPYTLVAGALDPASNKSWTRPRSKFAKFFLILGFGYPPLVGLPIATAFELERMLKISIKKIRSRIHPDFNQGNGTQEAAKHLPDTQEAAKHLAEVLKRARALLPGTDGQQLATEVAETVAHCLPDADFATHLGFALHVEGELRAAIAAYRRAVALDATRFDAWYALGCAELNSGAHAESIRCFRRSLTLRPTNALAHFGLGRALYHAGEVDSGLDSLRIAAEGGPELRREALACIARYISGSPRADNAAVLEARQAWAAIEIAAEGGPFEPLRRVISAGGKLRIGYMSAFFADANWMKPVWGVINHHDRSRFEIHLIFDGDPPTADCGYKPNAQDRITDARGLSNRNLAAKIVELGVDVLVDLNGYSFQSRLSLFMRQPAPLIIGWFNMYATTGIDAFDYIVGDAAVIPQQEECFYSERVVRVPGSYLAFSVLYPVPAIVPPPCLATGHLTFGSFASQYKLTNEVIAAWAAILTRASNARLLIKNRALGEASNQAALHERFHRHCIDAERVLLEGPEEHYQFLAAYARVDIALDPFPYSGGTTTSEALWAGVPVLTFNGDRWASRTSRSLLLAAGLDDWCTPDLDAYIDRAVTLAGNSATFRELAALRENMRTRLGATLACDSAGLCRALESVYREGISAKQY